MEKKIRIFSLANPKAAPEIYEFKSPIKIAMLCQNDQTILSVGEDSAIR